MAGITNILDDDIENYLNRMTKYGNDEGGYRIPPELLEALGAGPMNRAGQGKITNLPDDKVGKVLKDFAFKSEFGVPQSEETRKKGFPLLKERARALATRAKYYEATSILEEIESTEEITELGMKLLMAECYLQLGRENKANKSIRSLRSVLLADPSFEAEAGLSLVENLVDNKSFVSGLILLPVVSDLFMRQANPDDTVEGLFRCVVKANDCTRPMISNGGRDRVLAIDFGMDYMVDVIKDLSGLNANAQKKAFKQCLASTLVAYDYWMLKENAKGIKIREESIAAMDQAFGVQAAKQRRIYGNLLYNIGVGYDILSKPTQAKDAYDRAIEALEMATDFDDESDRQRDIKLARQKLKELYK